MTKKVVQFETLKPKILAALESRIAKMPEKVILLEGFINEPFGQEISHALVIGGPTLPMVMLVGEETGQVYFFALKALIDTYE